MSKFLSTRIKRNRIRDEWYVTKINKYEDEIVDTKKRKVEVKGYANRKHTFEIDITNMSGYTFVTLKKNGNPILRCDPQEFLKFKSLFKKLKKDL